MRNRMSLMSMAVTACFAACSVALADATVSSTAFVYTGHWPANQPVAVGSTVPDTPPNIAASTAGGTAFANGEFGTPHTIAHLNDSTYGNAYSWITANGGSLSRNVVLGGSYGTVNMSFAGIAFYNATLYTLSDIVIGRSAANEYPDRFAGNYYIQITTASSVPDIINTDAAADSQWTTVGYFTASDPYEHQFTFTPAVSATGVRIVTTAGNCIDEIVVHGVLPTAPLWPDQNFIWANPTGGTWSNGANWTNGISPNDIYDRVGMTSAPLSSKAIVNDTTYGLLEGMGYQYGTLTVDSTLGDASPVTFAGDPFYLWLSDINVMGNLVMSNAVESYSELRLNAYGEVALSEWAPTLITQSKLHVLRGTLKVGGTVSSDASVLPAGAWMHLDASRTNTLSLADAGGGTFFVQQWNDVNGNGTYAYAEAPVNRPVWQIEDGIPQVNFGFLTFGESGGIMNGKTLTWSAPDTAIRTAFIVYSDVPGDPYVQSILCSKSLPGVDFCRNGYLFNPQVASPAVTGGTITLDGARVDGTDGNGQFSAWLSSGFHVISVTTTGDAAADCFARDHMGHAGGQKLAEVVLYNRALTTAERKAAEAYLMGKWSANPLPTDASAGAGQAASLTLDNLTTLNAASDFRTLNLTVNGNATKAGEGTLTAAQITQMSGVFTLSNGTLAVTGDMLSENEHVTPIPDPWAHLDASVATSLGTETVDGIISVKSWSDLRGGDRLVATCPEDSTSPTLVTNGLNGLPFVDFGNLTLFSASGANMVWNTTNSFIRTVVMVYSDSTNYYYHADGRELRSCFLGNTYSSLDFWRGNDGILAYEACTPNVRFGHFAVDGKAALPSTYLSVGFHVLSFVTVGNTHSEAFARSLSDWSGGQRLAEVMIWNLPLTSPQLRNIEQQLMVKWLGRSAPGYPARAVTGPAVEPWMHVDATDTNSMELVDVGGTLYVQKWNDVRSNGVYASAIADQYRPVWQAGNGFPYVDFGLLAGPGMNPGTELGQHLCWSETNTTLRTVFLVYSDADSGLDQNFIGSLSGDLPFNRGVDHNFFHAGNASPNVVQGIHSLDYGMVNGNTTPLPRGFHVVGIATRHGKSVHGEVFARDRDGHAGGQKLAEVLVYNRELTDGEFRQTRRYLMQKWFKAPSEQESDLYTLVGTTGSTLDVGAGQTLTCRNQTCPGTLEKRGAGRLILANGTAGGLSVPDGELWLEKPFAAAGGAPLSALTLGNNATINLMRNAFSVQTLSGVGTVSNGTVTAAAVMPGTVGGAPQNVTIAGDLVLTDACEIAIDATDEAGDGIVVSGTLTLPSNGRVTISFPQDARMPASQHLFTFGTLAGTPDLSSWTVDLTPSGIYTATLVVGEHTIDLSYHPRGTLIQIR